MSYLKSPFQIYVHCPNDGCECHRNARNFLHSWGIEASFGYDGDHYLEFTVPQGWSQDKIKKFSDALSKKLKIVEATDSSRRTAEEPNLNWRRNMNDRGAVIEKMVDQYRDQLEEKDDDDLLGSSRLAIFREDAKVLVHNMLEALREETIEELVESYQKNLEGMSEQELFGGQGDSKQ